MLSNNRFGAFMVILFIFRVALIVALTFVTLHFVSKYW